MKDKELLKSIDKCLSEENQNADSLDLDIKLNAKMIKKAIYTIVTFGLLIFMSILLYKYASKLSIISPLLFIIILVILLSLSVGFLIYSKLTKKDCNNLKRHYRIYNIYDIVSFVGIVFGVFFTIFIYILTPAEVTGTSMENTYINGDRVLVWNIGYTPKKSDVVIIDVKGSNYLVSEKTNFIIKRVVAIPGDKLIYDSEDNIIYLNDDKNKVVLTEKETNSLTNVYDSFKNMTTDKINNVKYYSGNSATIPMGFYVVLGDNRVPSCDSRIIGFIHADDILGKTTCVIYPFNRIGVKKETHKS